MTMSTEVVAASLLPGRAAIWVADRLCTAVAERGEAHLAVSGGSTPLAMFGALAALPLPWPQVHVWQVDERVAPDGDGDRNAGQLETLRTAGAVIHLMDVTNPSLPDAAASYAAALPDRFDVIHLGLGDDGHTASWPPRDPVVNLTERVAVVGPFKDRMRLTLTPPVVNNARHVMFLVAGAAKAPMLARLTKGDPSIPATAVRRTGTTILTDVS
jgi:6-phosphogluconolactonase